jgi:valyl-tRNA synthetase
VDVFDTWMDSSLSPAYISFWKRDMDKFERYFPAGLRPQSSDIIRTWAFYSLLRSHLLFESRPWTDIMIDGFILSPDGTPMHTSLGNFIDPIETLEEFGSDVLRYLSSLCSLGQDSNFRPPDLTRGRRFVEKFWNVQQFIGMSLEKGAAEVEPTNPIDLWILDLLAELIENVSTHYGNFDFASVMREVQYFVWHELADHYIELVKARVYSGEDTGINATLKTVGLSICKLLAPIMPHVTEEIYQQLYSDDGASSIHLASMPAALPRDPGARVVGEFAKEVTAAVRRWKSEKGWSLNRPLAGIEVLTELKEAGEAVGDIKSALAAEELTIAREDPTLREEPIALKPVHSRIGPRFRGDTGEVMKLIASADPGEAARALQGDGWKVALPGGREEVLTAQDVEVESGWISHGRAVEAIPAGDSVVVVRPE